MIILLVVVVIFIVIVTVSVIVSPSLLLAKTTGTSPHSWFHPWTLTTTTQQLRS
jgi:hypothetical protein